MRPLAPARFSTTTVWPRLSDIFSARMRATTSVPPPAEKPTSILIGLSGNLAVCAAADPAATPAASASPSSRHHVLRIMSLPGGFLVFFYGSRSEHQRVLTANSPLGLVVERHRVELEPVVDQPIAEAARHLGLPPLALLGLTLDHLAAAQVDEMVAVPVGHRLVARPPVAEIVALDDAGIVEQLHRPVDGGDRDAVIDRGAALVELLDVGMVVRGRQHARDDAALLGHAHAFGSA